METSNDIVVGPSLPKLFLATFVGLMGGMAGIMLGIGFNSITLGIGSVIAVLGLGIFIACIVTNTPRLEISERGFTMKRVMGSLSYTWDEIEAPFEVMKLGLVQAVGFNLTEASRTERKITKRGKHAGFDAVLAGALAAPMANIVERLNEKRSAWLRQKIAISI